jgi:hypothetical protein
VLLPAGDAVIVRAPLYTLYGESLRKYTGWCIPNGFAGQVLSVWLSEEQCFAFVEFVTAEDAVRPRASGRIVVLEKEVPIT